MCHKHAAALSLSPNVAWYLSPKVLFSGFEKLSRGIDAWEEKNLILNSAAHLSEHLISLFGKGERSYCGAKVLKIQFL